MRYVVGYKPSVSGDPEALSSYFPACWVILYLLEPVVVLRQGPM